MTNMTAHQLFTSSHEIMYGGHEIYYSGHNFMTTIISVQYSGGVC